ncbi:MAG: carboxymuconolactone decarboxylase family protein [Candidatus Bathyarchaeia archaeon]
MENRKIIPKSNSLLRQLPQVANCFNQLHDSIMADGALSEKIKELIAVGISVAIRCSPCIQKHVAKALETGNSDAEISEAISVGILMGGGPATAYASEAMNLLYSLSEAKKGKLTLQ